MKRIAVVGAGVSGLTAARVLARKHQVTVFEAEDRAGGHTRTVTVTRPEGEYRVDVGFIVFNDRTYPNFIQLLGELGIEGRPTSMGFAVSAEETGVEYCGDGLGGFFAQKRRLFSATHWRMLADILRFNREAPALLEARTGELPLLEYLDQEGYGERFRSHYILPMGGAIWSCSLEQMQQFPARFFVRFFNHHGLLSLRNRPQWYVVPGGSDTYVRALVRRSGFELRTGCAALQVHREKGGVVVRTLAHGEELFDDVVLGCHADDSLRLLSDADREEHAFLSAIPYQENEVVLHTDTTLLPGNPRCWSSWNALLPVEGLDRVRVTYNMNILQGIDAPEVFCVTLNGSALIDPAKIIGRYRMFHPLFTPRGLALRSRFRHANGRSNVWFCGAWDGNGFHEDGVVSALKVAKRLDETR